MPDESIAKRTQRPLARKSLHGPRRRGVSAYGLRQPAARHLERAPLPLLLANSMVLHWRLIGARASKGARGAALLLVWHLQHRTTDLDTMTFLGESMCTAAITEKISSSSDARGRHQ